MPATGNSYRAFPDTDLVRCVTSGVHSLRLHFRTAVHRATLTRSLADGADPTGNGELALRTRQLTSERTRTMLARTLRWSIADARRPARTRSAVPIIDRPAVLDAQAAIAEMIERLLSARPVQAQGMALLERIITNAEGGSPLYNSSQSGALRRTVSGATAALDAQSAHLHELRWPCNRFAPTSPSGGGSDSLPPDARSRRSRARERLSVCREVFSVYREVWSARFRSRPLEGPMYPPAALRSLADTARPSSSHRSVI